MDDRIENGVPKKVDASARRDRQLLVRLTADELEWLESAAHLEHVTPSAYAHRLLADHASRLGSNAYVRTDVENRRAFRDASSATVSLLRSGADSDDGVASTDPAARDSPGEKPAER